MSFKVLCVCWDSSLQRSRVWVLESAGFAVRSAGTPQDAAALLSRHGFDLVVLGHSLSHDEKLELRRLSSGAVVVALRRSDEPHEPGFDASVDSGAGPENLLEVIDRLLHRRRRIARA